MTKDLLDLAIQAFAAVTVQGGRANCSNEKTGDGKGGKDWSREKEEWEAGEKGKWKAGEGERRSREQVLLQQVTVQSQLRLCFIVYLLQGLQGSRTVSYKKRRKSKSKGTFSICVKAAEA